MDFLKICISKLYMYLLFPAATEGVAEGDIEMPFIHPSVRPSIRP